MESRDALGKECFRKKENKEKKSYTFLSNSERGQAYNAEIYPSVEILKGKVHYLIKR